METTLRFGLQTKLRCSCVRQHKFVKLGAIIRNDKGDVMAAFSARGPLVANSEEAKVLVCRKSRVCNGCWVHGAGD